MRARPVARADNWGMKTPEFQRAFIESHLRDVAESVKKPFILEECVERRKRMAAARDTGC